MSTTHQLPQRRLGKQGPLVPAIGLGLMGLSTFYGPVPSDEERFTFLDRAHALGAVHWDSSDMYGDSETLLGKWFNRSNKRKDIFLATKFGFVSWDENGIKVDSSAAHAKNALEASLKKLQTDYIDLYYVHRANPDTPIEETMRAMVEFQKAGLIKYIGLSEVNSATLRRACKIGHVDALQIEYAASTLDIESDVGDNLLATCRELGVAVVAYSPLGRGMLTGAIASASDVAQEGDIRSAMMPRFQGDNFATNVNAVKHLAQLAHTKQCTPAQLCLAWVLKQGNDIIPIPGTKKIKYLEENLAAAHIQLTDDEEAQVRNVVASMQNAGGRMPDMAAHLLINGTVEEA